MVREFTEQDREIVKAFLFGLQEYLVERDPRKLLIHFDDGGEAYLENLLKLVREQEGKIFIYEQNGEPVGLVAGYVQDLDTTDKLMSKIKKEGYVQELFVDESVRGKGIGSALMAAIEDFFRKRKCETITVTVDSFNESTHRLYKKLGYADRDILLMKEL